MAGYTKARPGPERLAIGMALFLYWWVTVLNEGQRHETFRTVLNDIPNDSLADLPAHLARAVVMVRQFAAPEDDAP